MWLQARDEEGIAEAARAEALTRVVAFQLSQEMARQGMTKAKLAVNRIEKGL